MFLPIMSSESNSHVLSSHMQVSIVLMYNSIMSMSKYLQYSCLNKCHSSKSNSHVETSHINVNQFSRS